MVSVMKVILIITAYLLILNILGFASMGLDKWRAIHREWRIPEATLFVIAIFGGAFGGTVGMYLFRHKTKHWYFRYGFPAIFVVQLLLAAYLWGFGIVKIL